MSLDKLTKIDGGGISTTSDYRVGVITATKFVGPFEGTITSTDATFTGNVSIAGTLTYEDVTNIDSVGIITARNGIFLPDNKKLELGNASGSGDLRIYHDSSDSYIQDAGTGDLIIKGSNNLDIKSAGDELKARFITNGSCEFYEDGTKRIETTGSGAAITGTLTATSLDISGNVDIDGVLETDGLTIDGVSLAETIADTVGAMVGSNTETGITVTYNDSDNTLDFVVGTLNQNTTGNAATATALATARAINGVNFDGTADITVTAAAGTLSGNTLASGVTASSLTSVGTLTGLTVSGNIAMTGTGAIDVPTGTTAQRPGSPTTGLFRYNSTEGEFEGYTASGWGAIAGGGGSGTDFTYLALRNASNNGAASYPASDFTLVTSGTTNAISPTQANALLVSYGGVIQQPNSGTSTPTTGFAINGSTIKFGSSIAGAPDFIIYLKGAGVGTPSDDTVDLAQLAHATQGDVLYYGASGAPARLGADNGKFLRSNGSSANPSWETVTSTPEGTAILSTGESGGSKYLREDGDGSCSWQAVPAGITINNNADNRVITGSGTANTLEGEASLTFDGTRVTSPAISASNGIIETAATVASNHTISTNYNALSAGPVTVSATVTIPSGSVWTIV